MKEGRETLLVGTRGSELALAQSREVITLLKSSSPDVRLETKIIKTEGDLRGNLITGKDAFTGAIDLALIDGEIDLAVHSLKDVPVGDFQRGEIEIGAFVKREAPFDVLISKKRGKKIDSLPTGSRIGTSSLRRAVQLKSYRPDFRVVEIHGNVKSRIRRLRKNSQLDAIVLARAGLERLGLEHEADQILPSEIMLPAVGQGCMAVAVRSGNSKTLKIVAKIDDQRSRQCSVAERAFSHKLGGGCNSPIAALAGYEESSLYLQGLAVRKQRGSFSILRDSLKGRSEKAKQLGEMLALKISSMLS